MAKKALKRGLFITLEGPEGCGKTTHAKLLAGFLKRRGYRCVSTREPGGTRAGEMIRELLLHSNGVDIDDATELFLFEAARAQIVREVIRPALAKKSIVICDRFSDATRCYQGYAGGVAPADIEALDRIATGGLQPELTILLDVDTLTGLKRACKKGVDRMEAKKVAYHRKVRKGYLALARRYPRRIKVVKVAGPIPVTQSLIRQELERFLAKNG